MRNDFCHVYTDGHNGPRFPYHRTKRSRILDEDGAAIRGGRTYRDAERGWRESDNVRHSLIRRFLTSRVGRVWNDVVSEVAYAVRGDSLGHDVMQGFLSSWRVDRKCILIDGELHDPRGCVVRGFYVDPVDGVLRHTDGGYSRYEWCTRRKLEAFLDGDLLTLNEPGADLKAVYERVGGCWFYRRWKDVPAYASGREVYRLKAETFKRQLSRKEVARLGLAEWTRLAGELKASINRRHYDERVHRRLVAIRDHAILIAAREAA